MNYSLPEDTWDEVHECWGISPNAIEVLVGPTKRYDRRYWVRVTARENIRSGATPPYFAGYEQKVTIRDADGSERAVWADVTSDYPWQDGETIQECLNGALVFVTMGDTD